MRRPLVAAGLCYGSGLLLAEFCQPPLPALFVCALALLALALVWSQGRALLLWPLIILTGWTNLASRVAVVSPHDLRLAAGDSAALVTVRGALCETPSRRVFARGEEQLSRTRAEIQVSSLLRGTNWQPAFGRVVVATPGDLGGEFFAGRTVEVFGVLAPPPLPLAEGLFDYRAYLSRQGIYHQLKADSADDWRLVPPVNTARPLSDRFLAWARTALARGLPAEDESLRLEWALTLGDKAVLTDEVSEPFVRAATYHIFAVDGLRMAIIFGIFFALFRALGLPRAVCGLLLIPLIWFYTALTGWPASAIRATVMLTIVIFGWAMKRPSDLINSLFAAALVILVWEPRQLFQAGFQLSFFVVLCIILMMPPLNQLARRLFKSDPLLPEQLRPRWQRILHPPARFALDFLLVSFAAWIGSIPLAAYYFHIVTPVSAPANLLAVPLCAFVLVSDLISLLLAGWFPGAAELFNHAGWFLMECIRVSSHWFADWPGAWFYVAMPGLFAIALYYAILLAVLTGWLFKSKWRGWKIACLALLALVWCWQWRLERAATRLSVLPLGGGSAMYCDAPGRKDDVLIDCGNESQAGFVVKPFLRAQGVNRLERLLLTHGDLRQVGGTELISTNFAVKQIVTSPVRFRSPAYRNILQSLERAPERWQKVKAGDTLGPWTVLHPQPADNFPQADDNALVLRGNFRAVRILLVSDLGRPGQNALLERAPDLRADVVVAGLPTEAEPLCDALLDAIQPRAIVIADSEFPATRRAGAGLRERLARRNVPVIYTSASGAVTVTVIGGGWELRTMDGRRLRFQEAGRGGGGRASAADRATGVRPASDSTGAALMKFVLSFSNR
jgi:competence protein ComEC